MDVNNDNFFLSLVCSINIIFSLQFLAIFGSDSHFGNLLLIERNWPVHLCSSVQFWQSDSKAKRYRLLWLYCVSILILRFKIYHSIFLDTLDLSGQDLQKLLRAAPECTLNTTTLILDNNSLQRLDNIHTYQCIEKVRVSDLHKLYFSDSMTTKSIVVFMRLEEN